MATTYALIASTTGNGSATTLSFTSIPNTYTDLVLILNGSLTSGQNVYMRFNNNTSAVYSQTVLGGDGSSAFSYATTAVTSFPYVGYNDTGIGTTIFNILNYSNTTTNKTFLSRNSKVTNQAAASVGLWQSTAAINQIDIYPASASPPAWTTATTATLYGIKSA